MEKAYKILALQLKVSNNEAKALIDAGVVSLRGKKVEMARALVDEKAEFKVQNIASPVKIFEDENVVAVEKPAFVTSEKVSALFKFPLLNRLDKETSGVVLLYKNEDFQQKAIAEFAACRVQKLYYAIVCGIVSEPFVVDLPISVVKTKSGALAKIDKFGKSAFTSVEPLSVEGKKSLVKVEIKTGRTHQIRAHLAHAGFGVFGDEKYAKSHAKRLYLHSAYIKLFDYEFRSKIDKSFREFFEV